MKLDDLKLSYVQKKNQFLLINDKGQIMESDNSLVQLKENQIKLADISVFMEGIEEEVKGLTVSEKLSFKGVQNPLSDRKGIYDVEVFSLALPEGPRYLCVFSDQSDNYEFLRDIQQRHNENAIEQEFVKERTLKIEERDKDTIDSIQYAKRIQQTILPSIDKLESLLSKFFIIDRQKDIVGGDFYWIKKVEEKVLFAVVDCTGHGVPGAFMSIIAQNLLNQAVDEIGLSTPSEILTYLNDRIYRSFSKDGMDGMDGMDMAICLMDFESSRMQYSGANIPLYLARGGIMQMIRGTRQHIGTLSKEASKSFESHLLPLQEGDCFYLATDGYIDQFGGPEEKKYGAKKLQELLLSLKDSDMPRQKEMLQEAHQDWKGDLHQVDDILIAGIKVTR